MARLEKQKHGSYFLKPSSSFSRQTVHVTFLLMLLPSMCFSEVTKETTFCFDTREGDRLNATVRKKLHAWHDVDCVVRCLDDTCCRSVNYLKTLDFDKDEDDNKDNCELLYDVAVSGKNDSLLRNDDYDYFILKNPERSFNCSCVKCEYNKTCNGFSEKCECPTGFTGSQCEDDIDECISNPCNTNATCDNHKGSYTCECKEGFTGDGTSCTDIDECISNTCNKNATCIDAINSYNCECKEGFTGDATSCTEIDECISNPCHTNAVCKDAINSYDCTCEEGFTGNGTTCTDIDECISNPCETNGTCQNTFGSYSCICYAGFTGYGTSCTDIDECISSPCHTNSECNNTISSYICKCKEGFNGDGTNCEDIDECIFNPCDTNATCNNYKGSYVCTCNYGFAGDGTTCTDINECSSNPCGDHEDCEDGIGSYRCKCEEGYLNDGTTCQEIKWDKEGNNKHLKAFVYKKNITQSTEDCKNLCVEDDCCRSINYRTDPPSGEEKICELFHTVKEQSWQLEDKPPGYEHHKLNPSLNNVATNN